MKKALFLLLVTAMPSCLFAQNNFSSDVGKGTLSGDLMMNMNFFQKDTAIGACCNPLYDNALSGGEAWLSLRYNVSGYTFTFRGDVFNNSNLFNPTSPMNGFGVGAWNITKDFNDLTISVGFIYDQIGSGILYRAYEDRGLLIDNALKGVELKYKVNKNINVKGFTGEQKFLFSQYNPVIKGLNAEGDFTAGKVHLNPGLGVLNRTLDQGSMTSVAAAINGQEISTRFNPRYNTYAFTAYNNLTFKDISWYAEGAFKTHEAIIEPVNNNNILVDKPGNVEYTTLNYAKKGFAINLAGKRTQDFVMRTSPNEVLNNGELNWQPVVAILRPERLMSRYTPASQDISEMAGTANVLISPNDVTNYTFTFTHINTLENVELYREGYGEWYYQGLKSWIFQAGVQYMEYNQKLYQTAPTKGMVYAVTPFTEVPYRFNDVKSLRFEAQYMDTKQDKGSWIFALAEYNVAPKYSISFSDMYNVTPIEGQKALNYPTIFGAFTKGAHRFTLAYVKQVDGINCTGGVCRYEPAFSGVKATITSSF